MRLIGGEGGMASRTPGRGYRMVPAETGAQRRVNDSIPVAKTDRTEGDQCLRFRLLGCRVSRRIDTGHGE